MTSFRSYLMSDAVMRRDTWEGNAARWLEARAGGLPREPTSDTDLDRMLRFEVACPALTRSRLIAIYHEYRSTHRPEGETAA